MDRSDMPQEVLDGAYRIFIQEIKQHVTETQFILLDCDLPDHALLQDAKVRFHKIRGGAGFFGLSDIEQSAALLEKYCKQLLAHEKEEPILVRNAYNDLVEKINATMK